MDVGPYAGGMVSEVDGKSDAFALHLQQRDGNGRDPGEKTYRNLAVGPESRGVRRVDLGDAVFVLGGNPDGKHRKKQEEGKG